MRDEINVDDLVQDFLNLSTLIDQLSSENEKVKDDIQVSDKRLYMYATSEEHSNKEIRKLQEMIESYQTMLDEHSKIREENIHLKDCLAEAHSQKDMLEQEIRNNDEKFLHQISDLQDKHRQEVKHLQQRANDIANSEISVYESKLKSLWMDMEEIKSSMKEREKQHQSETSRIKIEYDIKIQKLQQRQLAQANTSSGSLSARNDIFRKKLLHFQAESEKELKCLKAKCTEQQQQLTDQQHQLKLQNKQIQDQSRQHDQVRQQEKLLRQNQTEIRRLQSQLKQEQGRVMDLQRTVHEQQECLTERLSSTGAPKRRRTMFNPRKNHLDLT